MRLNGYFVRKINPLANMCVVADRSTWGFRRYCLSVPFGSVYL
jgi:hypothetical protein